MYLHVSVVCVTLLPDVATSHASVLISIILYSKGLQNIILYASFNVFGRECNVTVYGPYIINGQGAGVFEQGTFLASRQWGVPLKKPLQPIFLRVLGKIKFPRGPLILAASKIKFPSPCP